MADSGRALSKAERQVMGGMLSKPMAVTEGPDGAVYVLDADFRKIVVFNRDGSLRRVILGGYGQGPGEFVRPVDLTLTSRGQVAVIDQSLGRLTIFDTSGTLVRSKALAVPYPYKVVATGDRFYIMRWYRPGQDAIAVFDTLGERQPSGFKPDKADYDLADGGEPGQLALSNDGKVQFAHPAPGRWTSVATGTTMGEPLVPETRVGYFDRAGSRTAYVTAGVRGLGWSADGSALLYYGVLNPDSLRQQRAYMEFFLARMDAAGRRRSVERLPDGAGWAFAISRSRPELLLSDLSDVPQIVRYRLP